MSALVTLPEPASGESRTAAAGAGVAICCTASGCTASRLHRGQPRQGAAHAAGASLSTTRLCMPGGSGACTVTRAACLYWQTAPCR
eukprot:1606194-Prymnesium_polylepis.1